jgi:hypothetical protein
MLRDPNCLPWPVKAHTPPVDVEAPEPGTIDRLGDGNLSYNRELRANTSKITSMSPVSLAMSAIRSVSRTLKLASCGNRFGRSCLPLLLLVHFVAGAVDPCSVIEGEFDAPISITASPCDAVIQFCLFRNLTDGAVSFRVDSRAIAITTTIFDTIRRDAEGGALRVTAANLQVNRTCFSYCYTPADGKHLFVEVYNGDSVSGDCSFYASYPLGETSSATPGNALSARGSYQTYYFRNENHTRSDAMQSSSAAVGSDSPSCVANRRFSTFADCRESYILWIDAETKGLDIIEYTNFLSNDLSQGVLCSNNQGCTVSHCVFVGEARFFALLSPFVFMDCVFDRQPEDQWSTTGTGNLFLATTETIEVSVVPCLLPLSATPLPTITDTAAATGTDQMTPTGTEQMTPTRTEQMTATRTEQMSPTSSKEMTQTANDEAAAKGRVSAAVIAAAILVLAVLTAVAGVVLWWCHHRKRSDSEYRDIDQWISELRLD